MLYLFLSLFVAGIVVADQLVKYLVVTNIPLGGVVPVLDGVLHLTYVQNTGAAFSMLRGGRWLFVAMFAVAVVAVAAMIRKKLLSKPVELWCIAAVLGGGVGNLIDRLLHSYVVDMLEVEFMSFAVFNVADIFITCGAIFLAVYVLLFDREKKDESDDAADE